MRNLICLCIFSLSIYMTQGSIDLKKVEIYGPGLNPVEIVLPARYFFVNFTESSEKTDFFNVKADLSVSVTGKYNGKRECRITVNILDRKDGVFIVRYKLHESCSDFIINVKYKGSHLGDSPYIFSGKVIHEECNCPQESINEWLKNNNCLNKNYKQIHEDLKPFQSVNFTSFRKEALKKFDHPGSMSVCNYVVVKNQIYRKCYGEHVGFKIFMDAILLSIARKTILPDFEIFVNLGDWPLVKKDGGKVYPLFSWCGSDSTYDIVMPTYDLTQSSLECMGRVSLDMLSVQGNIDKSWNEKESKAFWRGRDASLERLKLIEIARQNPTLFNASLTNFFFFRDRESEYGPKEKHISFFKFFDYKYQLNLDGTVAAYRFPFLLVGNSLVFKQESNYYEHFYSDLKPFHHYIPVKRDLSDLVEKIDWAIKHDDEAKAVSINGQRYALDNLLPLHVFCYHSVLFYEWSKLIDSPIKRRKNMDHVTQPDQEGCICDKDYTKRKVADEL